MTSAVAHACPPRAFASIRAKEMLLQSINLLVLPPMSAARQTMGLRGERVAEKWLSVHGWEIAERRFRNGHRDIDLVATKLEGVSRTVAFVEVKTRTSADFGGPVSAVNWRKQRELTRSAKVWMSRFQKPGDTFRFDVIGVLLGAESIRVQHVENAFLIQSKS